MRELLVVEFCDPADAPGAYRKYSATCVQGRVAAQYVAVNRHWMVKFHGGKFREEWAHEERDYIRRNPHAAEINHIFSLAGIDYGRIDYGMLDGRIQVWEINTNPSNGGPPLNSGIERTPPDIMRLQRPNRKLFFEQFESMLSSVDSEHEPSLFR